MSKRMVMVLLVFGLFFPAPLLADECMEGDCDNGFGSGFTDNSKIYEGEWKDGLPHGQGKLYVSKGKIIEGTWDKGELVQEKAAGAAEEETEMRVNKEKTK